MRSRNAAFIGALFAAACQGGGHGEPAQVIARADKSALTRDTVQAVVRDDAMQATAKAQVAAESRTGSRATIDTAMFSGGCFWSMERPFQHVPGVIATSVGYAGGHTANPTYEQVNTGTTGHAETVLVEFDPSKVTYEKLLDVYWHNIDPVTKDRQFCDGGADYRTIIFTRGASQRSAALASRDALTRSGHFKTPIVTELVEGSTFWRGEEYHQHFAERNPERYDTYRRGCGREARLRELWGDAASPYVPASQPGR